MKDDYDRVLTYLVYSHSKEQFVGEFNTLKEARNFARDK